jgi:hypothetical protein
MMIATLGAIVVDKTLGVVEKVGSGAAWVFVSDEVCLAASSE